MAGTDFTILLVLFIASRNDVFPKAPWPRLSLITFISKEDIAKKRKSRARYLSQNLFQHRAENHLWEFQPARCPADGLSTQHKSIKKNWIMSFPQYLFQWFCLGNHIHFSSTTPADPLSIPNTVSLNSTNHKCLFVTWILNTVTNAAPLTSMVLEDFRSVCSQDINRYSYKTVLRSNNIEKHLLKQSLYAERMFNVHQTPQDRARTCSMFQIHLILTLPGSG